MEIKGSLPFWSWNDELEPEKLKAQIKWMHEQGIGGFFMHARGGLKTEYLSERWHECVKACTEYANELGMESWAYDENGWPSGFAGGKLLEDESNRDCEVFYEIGAYDEKAVVSYVDDGERLIRTTSGDNVINVYVRRSASTADILNPEVVDKFIALTHEEYKKRDAEHGLMGFFTDEPQYFRWNTPYTVVMDDYFKAHYGKSVIDELGLLFFEREGYRTFRYRYWKAMQTLMLESFGKKIYEWCEKNGYSLTGHYVQEQCLADQMMCCGGVMPFYEYMQVPGIDWLGRTTANCVTPRQLGSVAAQLGKKLTLTETFACTGWDATPLELKKIADFQYVAGANRMCQHLLPYSERGQRKRDYPSHFSSVNPWINKGFREFNDYYTRLTDLLSGSKEQARVGVFQTIRSAYFDWKRKEFKSSVKPLDDSYSAVSEELTERQIAFHYLDETIMARHAKVNGATLEVGECAYDYIIFPLCYTMDVSTKELLEQYCANGGRVLLTAGKPSYLEGEPYDYDFLKSNVTMDEIAASCELIAERHPSVRTDVRRDENGNVFAFAVNLGGDTVLKVKGTYRTVNPASGEEKTQSGEIYFAEGESLLLYPSEGKGDKCESYEDVTLADSFEVVDSSENYLTLDNVRTSVDGVSYGEEKNVRTVFSELLKSRYEGKLFLKYTFTARSLPETAFFTCEYDRVSVNGKEVETYEPSPFGIGFYRFDVARLLKTGENEIVVELDYYQDENVYYALFGEGVTESLRNCLVYDTDIEAGYLSGDFGVYGSFAKGENENVLLGEDFYIDRKKKQLSSLIEDGFPFFAGNIKLKQSFTCNGGKTRFVVPDRFQIIDVKVNGRAAGRLMFNKKLDISELVGKGENELEIELTVSNRNLFGPFHQPTEEILWAGPGSWDNNVRRSYALVKTII